MLVGGNLPLDHRARGFQGLLPRRFGFTREGHIGNPRARLAARATRLPASSQVPVLR